MKVKQISVFLENRRGRLSEVLKILGAAAINIRALSLADTSDFGILRLIVPRPGEAKKILEKNRFTVSVTPVIAVAVTDEPGGLAGVTTTLSEASTNVEYLYAFVEKQGREAIVILRVENIARAEKCLRAAGVKLLSAEDLARL